MVRYTALAALLFLPLGLGCCKGKADFVFEKEVKYKNIVKISQDDTSSGYTIQTTTLETKDPGTDAYLHKSGNNELRVIKNIPANSNELPYATVIVYHDKSSGAKQHKTELYVKENAKLPGEEGAPATVVFLDWPKPAEGVAGK